MVNEMKRRIYSVLVENRAGVLCKVAGLFSRRCFNIDSLAVGETDDPKVSCMTIVSSGDERTIEQIEKQLNKKLDVIKVKTFAEQQCVTRELMLIKIRYNKNNRREIMELCEIMKTEIVDMSKHFMMLQICDTPDRVNLLINLLQTISIVEVARTGTLALAKCCENDEAK
jgi:acetolactate synthase-1/3 small subunit